MTYKWAGRCCEKKNVTGTDEYFIHNLQVSWQMQSKTTPILSSDCTTLSSSGSTLSISRTRPTISPRKTLSLWVYTSVFFRLMEAVQIRISVPGTWTINQTWTRVHRLSANIVHIYSRLMRIRLLCKVIVINNGNVRGKLLHPRIKFTCVPPPLPPPPTKKKKRGGGGSGGELRNKFSEKWMSYCCRFF